MKNIPILVLIAFGLTACGGAPSESDIKEALNKALDQQNKMMDAIGSANNPMANMLKMEYTSVKKIGCNADGEKAYKCDVEINIKTGNTAQKTTAPVRFIKGSDGWVASR